MDELILHRYLDGRLDELQRSAVEETLRTDATARRTLNALREEARLIGESLESLSEPSRRIGDKVVAQLHLEERSRVAVARTRKLFWRLGQAAAFAAMLMLCLYLVKPRSESGTFTSGTAATVVVNGDRREAKKGQRIYDNDGIETAKGQFVRLDLTGGGTIDIDEFSALTLEKSGSAPILRLTRGRIGVNTGAVARGVQIELPQGVVTVQANSKADIWMPEAEAARWPALFYSADLISKLNASEPRSQNEPRLQNEPRPQGSGNSAIVTVFSGSAQLTCAKNAAVLSAQQGTRVRMMQSEMQQRPVNLSGSRVLDVRGDEAIHGRDNLVPAEWALLGLLDKPHFETLGRRWGLCDGTSPQIAQALLKLDAAMRVTAHADRADKIAAAQQALRQACETLPEKDERLRRASTLEGLAHFEEGYARAAAGGTKGSDPRAAFDAARVAFDDALSAEAAPNTAAPNAADWQTSFNGAAAPSFAALTPEAQSALTATFRRAAALYWDATLSSVTIFLDSQEMALDSEDRQRKLEESADVFAKLHEDLGHTVEGLAANLGEALCQAQLSIEFGAAGEPARRKALDALALILSKPLANTGGAARQAFEGIRQAALLESVRLHARGPDAQKTLNAAHDFALLYPLETNTPAAAELNALALKGVEAQKNAALRERRFENAVEACDAWLILLDEADGHWMDAGQSNPADERHIGARLDLLEALIGAKDWARAAGEAHAMSGAVPAELKPRFETLTAQIKK
ncbi:MAG TPA: hypothetical protein VKX17_00535 [Planctomycetota bacterium]|nr:hypothetical protein [Planctomycetota bacterium]